MKSIANGDLQGADEQLVRLVQQGEEEEHDHNEHGIKVAFFLHGLSSSNQDI
jgi:hypothetical protein